MVKSLAYILKRAIIFIICVNLVYVSINIAADGRFSLKESIYSGRLQYIHLTTESKEPTLNFKNELNRLFKKVEEDVKGRFWLKDTEQSETAVSIDSNKFLPDSPNSWAKKNTLFYDIRVTLALYLNYIKVQNEKKLEVPPSSASSSSSSTRNNVPELADVISVPFNWVDWIDLTDLNNELSLPLEDRTSCKWFRSHVTPHRSNYKHSKCRDSSDLSIDDIKNMGFRNREQIPGYVIDNFSMDRATIDARIMQANSYKMTHLPLPYKLLFLNGNNGTYEVNVDQGFPRKRITESDLMSSYLSNKNWLKQGSGPQKLTLDPVKEFKELKASVEPLKLQKDDDIHNVYKITHSFDGQSKLLPIEKANFHYEEQDIVFQINEYIKKADERKLNYIEKLYVDSLLLSKERNTETEDVYFRQATLWHDHDSKNKDQDRGYHYDWRFFVGTLTNYRSDWTAEEMTLRQEVILDRMARSWFRFAEEKGFISWIMHGPLLSWYWDGLMFPFDDDLDIQMPAKELARLGELYNQTLVIEDVEEGFGKYLIDIGTYVHNRDISKRENHIDARFIDIDSGLYIDITGLGISSATVPEEFENDKELLKITKTEEQDDEIYNDRRKHFYKHSQLSPFRYSQLGGVPVFVPHDITKRLMFEYPEGVTKPEFHNWYYVPQISLWVHKDKLIAAFDDNDFRILSNNANEHGKVDDEKLNELILNMEEEQVLQLLERDDDILCEYYKTKEITAIHDTEFKFLFQQSPLADGKGLIAEDKLLSGKEFDEYSAFVSNKIRMSKPLRKSYFQYHYIDQPKHHEEFLEKAAAEEHRKHI